jgi:S1-C subfamily serine protease
MTTAQQQFDQTAVFFARSLGKPRVGTLVIDLPPELRTQMQRNTGAYVDIVLEDSPAFAANILGGDVITDINGVQVINAKQATEIFESPQSVSTPLSLKILRNGSERVIVVPPRAR